VLMIRQPVIPHSPAAGSVTEVYSTHQLTYTQ
jgi:hypothetical protein